MLQRNTTGSPLTLPTLDPPVEVPPGGQIDHDTLLVGFEPVTAPDATPSSAPALTPDTAPDPTPPPPVPAPFTPPPAAEGA